MTELFYREDGPQEAPALLLLHGLFGSADNMGTIARALRGEYRVIAADLRNHGRSPHMRGMSYPAMAADVADLMDRLNLQQAHIFGHSMGGKVAMQLALDHRTRVAGLIVGDIAPVAYPPHHNALLEGMAALAATGSHLPRRDAATHMAAFEPKPDILNFLMTNWRRQADSDTWGWRLNLDAICRDYSAIMAANTGDEPFRRPVLFLRGGDSDYVQASHRERILKLFPAAELMTITGAHHWFHSEKPDLTVRRIQRFLAELED